MRDNLLNPLLFVTYWTVYRLPRSTGSRCERVNVTPHLTARVTRVSRRGVGIRDHTVLPIAQHKWIHPALTPARQAGTWFTGHTPFYAVSVNGLHTDMDRVRVRDRVSGRVRDRDMVRACRPDSSGNLLTQCKMEFALIYLPRRDRMLSWPRCVIVCQNVSSAQTSYSLSTHLEASVRGTSSGWRTSSNVSSTLWMSTTKTRTPLSAALEWWRSITRPLFSFTWTHSIQEPE